MTEKKTRKPKGNRGELLDLNELEKVGTIEARIELEKLVLEKKRWRAFFKVGTILPRSYYKYHIDLDLDEAPYLERIADLEAELANSLFKEEKVSKKRVHEQITSIKKDLANMQEKCAHIEFAAIVDEIKYRDGGTLLTCFIPDDIIEPLNKQKYNFEAYKIALVPILA